MADARIDITDLVFTYAERIDEGDYEGVADLLGQAELSFEGFEGARRGRDEILALYAATTMRHLDGTPRTKHVTTNVVVKLDLERQTATARSYFTVLQDVPGALALQPVAAGRYHDQFARDPDGKWYFTARHVFLDLVGNVRHHLKVAHDGEMPRGR